MRGLTRNTEKLSPKPRNCTALRATFGVHIYSLVLFIKLGKQKHRNHKPERTITLSLRRPHTDLLQHFKWDSRSRSSHKDAPPRCCLEWENGPAGGGEQESEAGGGRVLPAGGGGRAVRRPRISQAGAGPRRRGAIAALYMSSKTTLAATVLACSAMALKTSSRSVKALS